MTDRSQNATPSRSGGFGELMSRNPLFFLLLVAAVLMTVYIEPFRKLLFGLAESATAQVPIGSFAGADLLKETLFWVAVALEIIVASFVVTLLLQAFRGSYAHHAMRRGIDSRSKGWLHQLSRLTTLLLIVFMAATPFLRQVIGDEWMSWVNNHLWMFLLVYLNLQLIETNQRRTTDITGFMIDNGLAILALIVGVVIFIRSGDSIWFPPLKADELNINLQSTAFDFTDLITGLSYGLRIAFAGKERDELPPTR